MKTHRKQLNFRRANIDRGEILNYKFDPAITVTVASTKTVVLDGDEISLSEATRRVRGLDAAYQIRGTDYWRHNGRPLVERFNETH